MTQIVNKRMNYEYIGPKLTISYGLQIRPGSAWTRGPAAAAAAESTSETFEGTTITERNWLGSKYRREHCALQLQLRTRKNAWLRWLTSVKLFFQRTSEGPCTTIRGPSASCQQQSAVRPVVPGSPAFENCIDLYEPLESGRSQNIDRDGYHTSHTAAASLRPQVVDTALAVADGWLDADICGHHILWLNEVPLLGRSSAAMHKACYEYLQHGCIGAANTPNWPS
ncbi:hypothetical protein AXG93_4316s1440 [Marchantia polymorpha subsp. ruderalis]|uniref:Uncharacterized protein n=1 Tax=Marchantia polymorpha subsp. ruderalis TaxID=1480154 RepID=A0A176VTA6_MARPO|nr:hypothetical protein AXG93_4316s1440 [Marchantia polymorpha subsp. ruderalis]